MYVRMYKNILLLYSYCIKITVLLYRIHRKKTVAIKGGRDRGQPWNYRNDDCFWSFQNNFSVVLDIRTLQDKHTIKTLSVKTTFILAAKQVREVCHTLPFLPVSKAYSNTFYIFWQYTYTYIDFVSFYDLDF